MKTAFCAESFETDLLLWIVVSHLLTADLVADLARALVKVSSEGGVQWDDLFEDQLAGGPPHLANLLVRHRTTSQPVASFLQRAIWPLIASNDDPPIAFDDKLSGAEMARFQAVRYAFELARRDLATYGELKRSLGAPPEALVPLLAAYDLVADLAKTGSVEGIEKLDLSLPQSPSVLSAVLLKHLGDLCLDLDRPHHARSLYRKAALRLSPQTPPAWAALQEGLKWIILQSDASARRDVEGPGRAAEVLLPPLQSQSLATAPIFRVNAPHDALNAEILAADSFSFPTIERTQVLFAPHLVVAHDLNAALDAWRRKEWRDANRFFWATLRRQIALGSASDARRTKALFGVFISEELTESIRRVRRPEGFVMAMRLMIESGDPEIVNKTHWSKPLLSAYLNKNLIEDLLARADAHAGVRSERRSVLIRLFAEWLIEMPADQKPLAAPLIDAIAVAARDEPFSTLQGRGLAGESLKALQRIAEVRPELARTASTAVADGIIAHLATGAFRPAWAALDTAYSYADVFEPTDLRRCIEATLALLDTIDPGDAAWPVIRPALGLLSDVPTQSLWCDDPSLGKRCAETVVRFGLASRSENVRLMFLLKDITPHLVLSKDQENAISEIVQDLRQRVHEINSSAVSGCIASLLEAPGVSGKAGVEEALSALRAVIDSAASAHRSIGLPLAYQPLLQLVQGETRLRRDLSLSNEGIRELLSPLLPSILRLWHAAAKNPLIFASFAIPPRTTPDAAIVHNWSFASIAFADFLGVREEVESALAEAAQRPELAASITVGRAVRLSGDPQTTLDPNTIRTDTEHAFYAALGQRLVLLRQEPEAVRHAVLQALTEQCIRLGPTGLDAAVFALAAVDGVVTSAPDAVDAYRQRLSRNEALKFSLGALLDSLYSINPRSVS